MALPTSRYVRILAVALLLSIAVFFSFSSLTEADGYPPYIDNSTGAVHYNILPWPTEAQFASQYYTHKGAPIIDKRIADPSNGGRAPQNYANVSSSCTSLSPDQINPSVAWYFDKTTDPSNPTLFFRWRVEQIPNNYATGPLTQPYQSVSPYFAAQWTVLMDIDGDGYREFAVNIDGNSGHPAEPVDVMKSIYSNTKNQSLDYVNDPSIYYLFHQPTAFVYQSYGIGDPYAAYNDYILNFRNSFSPVPVWPNGSAETIWDYGTTRVMNVSTDTCNEFIVDYQIPLNMLDATSVGGPKVTEYTPMCLAFVTANSNQDPLQKDVAFEAVKTFTGESGVPCGDIITPAGGTFLQPVITSVSATGCGPTTFTARIMAPLDANGFSTLATGANAPTFYLYRDLNGNGIADDGQSWASIGQATVSITDPAFWSLTYNTSSLNRGQYLVGVMATNTDSSGNPWKVTWSFLTQAQVDAGTPPASTGQYANPSPSPGVVVDSFYNTCGEYADLTKTVSPSYIGAGGVVTFTLSIQNRTSSPFTVSSLVDALPSGFSFQNAAPPAGAVPVGGTLAPAILPPGPSDGAAGTVTWTFDSANPAATIAAGGSGTLTFTAQVSSVTGTYSNTASAVTNDPDWGTLTSNPVDIGVGAPRLTIAKGASSYSVKAGDTVTYTITYSNDSPVDTTGVVLTDILPLGMTFVSASGSGTYDSVSRTITWSLPNLSSLEGPYSVTVSAIVEKTASQRTTNTASIDSNETAPASATTTIFVNSPMKIQKTADVTMLYPGTGNNRVVYTLTYQNTGSTALTNVTITDPTPSGFYYVNHTNSGPFTGSPVEVSGDGYGDDDGVCETNEPCVITWSAATLAAGASGSFTLTLEVVNPYSGAPYASNTATMASNEAPTVSDSALVGIYNSSGICDAYFFHDEMENVGFDGMGYSSNTIPPLPSQTGTGIPIIAPSRPAWIEAVRFYNPPSADDVPLSDTIESRMFIDRNAGSGITLRGTVYDYDPITGARTMLGQGQRTFLGSQTGLHTFTISRSGTLLAGHRLLWVYEAQTDHDFKTEQLLFQFDGTVPNSVSDTNPPIATTFAASHALLCINEPSLIIKKTADKATAVAGDNIRYTITVSNLGTVNATGSQVVDILPEGVTLLTTGPNRPTLNGTSLTLGTNYTCSGQTCTFPVNSSGAASGVMAAGASATLILNVTVNSPLAPGISSLTNYATADSNETSPVSDAVSTAIGLPNTPYVTLVKSADKTRLVPGDTVTYSILVVNTGLGTASNIVVSDSIPQTAYFSYVTGSITGGNSRSATGTPVSQLQWTITSLPSGGSATLSFQMVVASGGVPSGVTERSNFVSATEATTTPANSNTVIVSISTNANIQITKTTIPAAGPIEPGDTIQYTLTVSSIGGSTATGVLVTDPIPARTSYVPGTLIYQGAGQTDVLDADIAHYEGAANRTVFRIGDLSAGQTRTMKFSVVADATFPSGTTTVTNTATASATNTSDKHGVASLSVTAAPALYLSKAAPPVLPYPVTTLSAASNNTNQITVANSAYMQANDVIVLNAIPYQITAVAGNVITLDKVVPAGLGIGTQVMPTIKYVFTYGNSGNADATGVVIRETLVPGLSFISSYSSGSCVAGTPINCSVGTVAAGQSGSLLIRALPASTGTYTNFGTMLSDQVPTFNSNTVTTVVGALEVSKVTTTAQPVTVSGAPVTVQYAIALRSQIPNFTVSGFTLTDVLPEGFTFASQVSMTNGSCGTTPSAGSRIAIWTNCTVNQNLTAIITFNVTVSATASAGTYQNPVQATGGNLTPLLFDELLTTAEDVRIVIPGDISVNKAIVAGPIACPQGTCVDYRITVRNLGTAAATNISVNDTDTDGTTYPPAFLTYVSSTPSSGTYTSGPTTGVWSIPGPVASGASVTLDIRFSISSFTTTINNCATRTASSPPDTNPGNDRYCVPLIPTRVTLSSFNAFSEGGNVYIEWATSSEIDTAGFYLLRRDDQTGAYTRIHHNLLPAVLTSSHGGTYRILDRTAPSQADLTYLLIEVEGKGTLNQYGPFTVRPGASGSGEAVSTNLQSQVTDSKTAQNARWAFRSAGRLARYTDRDGTEVVSDAGDRKFHALAAPDNPQEYVRTPHGMSEERALRIKAYQEQRAKALQRIERGQGKVAKIAVTKDAMYYLHASKISTLFNISYAEAVNMLAEGSLRLSSQGSSVAYVRDENNTGIFFYGQGMDGIYTSENIYWISPGRGIEMETIDGGEPVPGPISSFPETVHAEENRFMVSGLVTDPKADYWLWDYIVAGNASLGTKAFTIRADGAVATPSPASLTVRFFGGTKTGAAADHHAVVKLNGTTIGEDRWAGTGEKVSVIAFSQSLLKNGENRIEIKGILDAGTPYSVFYVNSFDLTYERAYGAANDMLAFDAVEGSSMTVSGFTIPDVFLFEISDPRRPKMVTALNIQQDGTSYGMSFVPSSPAARYLAVSPDAILPVAEAWSDSPSRLRSRGNAAHHLIITTAALRETAQALADYRSLKGLRSMVVLLEDIMDEFNHGIYSPEAMREFLGYAKRNWRTAPRYVLLAGEGTYDYRDYLGKGDNLVPPMVVGTISGLFPSDSFFADTDADQVPDIAIGRLPVLTSEELRAAIDKIIAFEQNHASRVFFLADKPDSAGEFPADSDEIAALIPSAYPVEKIYLSEYQTDAARNLLVEGMKRGALLVHYIGHGGVDRIANTGLLKTSDLGMLVDMTSLPVFAAMTCVAGQFGIPGYDSLGEGLVLKPDGGAAAVWSATGMPYNNLSKALSMEFMKAAFESGEVRLGDMVLRGWTNFSRNGGPAFMVHIYNLLGDPALRVW